MAKDPHAMGTRVESVLRFDEIQLHAVVARDARQSLLKTSNYS